jgi:hypothetical protein
MNSPGPPVRGADVSEWLERAALLFRVTLLKCLPLATVALLCSDVPYLYWVLTGHDLTHGLPTDPTFWVLYSIAVALWVYLVSALMLQQRSFALGVAFTASTALAAAARRLPVLLLTCVLAQLSLTVGFLMLIVPGIFLLVCYLVLGPVVLFERHNPYMALVRCVLLVRTHWWKICAALVITVVVMLAAVLIVAAMLNILAQLLDGQGPAFEAIFATGSLVVGAVALVFLSALMLTLHSALASSSA